MIDRKLTKARRVIVMGAPLLACSKPEPHDSKTGTPGTQATTADPGTVTYGAQIARAFVSFGLERDATSGVLTAMTPAKLDLATGRIRRYWDTIRNVKLRDGRCARDVITNVTGHADHFHWEIVPSLSRPNPSATVGVCGG